MWKKGDTLIYKTAGVCVIENITEENFTGNTCKYYCLRPMGDEKNIIFIPEDNEYLASKMLPTLSKSEALDIISSFKTFECAWQENDKRRSEEFKQILDSQDRYRMASLINTIRQKRKEILSKGKKMRASDDDICAKAEKLLFSELAFVLECNISDICIKIFGT